MDSWWVFGGFKSLKHPFPTFIEEILGLASLLLRYFSTIAMVFCGFFFSFSFHFLVDFGIVEESFYGFRMPLKFGTIPLSFLFFFFFVFLFFWVEQPFGARGAARATCSRSLREEAAKAACSGRLFSQPLPAGCACGLLS